MLRWLLGGSLLAWVAMITYFLVVPRWPALRDSGLLNVSLGGVGVVLALVGLVQARRRARWRRLAWVALAASLLPFGFLSTYIYYLSYQLPAVPDAVAIGSLAPDFQLADTEGRERRLRQWRGQWLVLDFFRGHW